MGKTLIEALALAAKEAREEAELKQVRIAAALDVDQSTVARFEKGQWPRDPEAMVQAYAGETGRTSVSILTRMLDLYAGDANGNGSRRNRR